MSTNRPTAILAASVLLVFSLSLAALQSAEAQELGRQPLRFTLSEPTQRLEMIVNTSRILTTEHKIPRLLVDNERILRAQPIAPNQVQLSAVHTGFTTLTVWDEQGKEYTVDVLVYGDARELQNLIMTEFPEATLRVRPLASSVVITGHVPRAEMVSRIVQISEDYYPSVVNNITVSGVQQVLLHVKVMEVSRTKLRKFGIDWALFTNGDSIVSNSAGIISSSELDGMTGITSVATAAAETLTARLVGDSSAFFAFVEALRQHQLVKVLAEPTLVTVSGRPASFSSGGEFPIQVAAGLGTNTIEYREFGTRVDFVPIVLGNGRVRLEVRPQVSERDPTLAGSPDLPPGLRTRWVDTAVEMNAGQTLALAGLISNRVESENRGFPWLADLPWVGSAFRRVEELYNEVELLVLVTPEFVSALDPHEVPPCGPGQLTTSPGDIDLYWRGYLEVPRCCPDGTCGNCQPHGFQGDYQSPPPPADPAPSVPVEPVSHLRAAPLPRVMSGSEIEPSLIGPSGYDDLR